MSYLRNILPIGAAQAFDVFRRVRVEHPEAFFLESAAEIGGTAETSVIGLGDFELLRDRGGRAELLTGVQTLPLEKCFLEELRARVSALQSSSPGRFSDGGVFGVVGYDCVADLEPSLRELPYFSRTPGEIRATVLIARQLIVFEHIRGEVHLVNLPSSAEKFLAGALAPQNFTAGAADLDPARLRASLGRQGYREGLNTIQEHVRAGDVFQAVLAERFECEVNAKPLEVFAALRASSPAPYSFFFQFGEVSFFGASPETLVRVSNGKLRSHPIAGTRPRGKNPATDRAFARSLKRSRKEAAEHMMLVDLARNDLGRVARPGSVAVHSFRQLRRFSNVMHLVSDVQAELAQGLGAVDVFRAAFPAGTLSGAPKVRAIQILAGLEATPRGYYGGAVVAFDGKGGLDSCIAIRAAEMLGSTAVLRAGAGIVADSKFESEYQEVSHKLRALRIAIGMAESAS
jgi:anthranilate synthase component 1